ncbi:hypothetical protein DNTS_005346, partial [Danionella cerebrum]
MKSQPRHAHISTEAGEWDEELLACFASSALLQSAVGWDDGGVELLSWRPQVDPFCQAFKEYPLFQKLHLKGLGPKNYLRRRCYAVAINAGLQHLYTGLFFPVILCREWDSWDFWKLLTPVRAVLLYQHLTGPAEEGGHRTGHPDYSSQKQVRGPEAHPGSCQLKRHHSLPGCGCRALLLSRFMADCQECTLEVLDVPEDIDEDILNLYFENQRRSGGGSLVSLEKRGSQAFVVFADPERINTDTQTLTASHLIPLLFCVCAPSAMLSSPAGLLCATVFPAKHVLTLAEQKPPLA